MTLITIIIFLLVLAVLVIVHELGHFFVARKFGVGVKEFGVGYPPRLKKIGRWWDTDFVLNAIPLGGYVSLEGEEEDPAEASEATDKASQRQFFTKKPWQRFAVIVAGPVANFVLALLVFIIVYSVLGIPQRVPDAVYLSYIEPDSPAAQAGLKAETQLKRLSDSEGEVLEARQVSEVIAFIGAHKGQQLLLTTTGECQSGTCAGEETTYPAYVRTDEERGEQSGSLGIALTDEQIFFYPFYRHLPLSIYYGTRESLVMAREMLGGLGQALASLFGGAKETGVVVMGPVGIVAELNKQQTFSAGFLAVLNFMGLLSLNLAIVNLLPIPAVDGGRLLLILIEKVVGRARVAKFELGLNYGGFIVLIGLAILVTGNDIWRLLVG